MEGRICVVFQLFVWQHVPTCWDLNYPTGECMCLHACFLSTAPWRLLTVRIGTGPGSFLGEGVDVCDHVQNSNSCLHGLCDYSGRLLSCSAKVVCTGQPLFSGWLCIVCGRNYLLSWMMACQHIVIEPSPYIDWCLSQIANVEGIFGEQPHN